MAQLFSLGVMSHDTSALVSLAIVTLIGVLGIAFVLFGGVRRLQRQHTQLDSIVKIDRERFLIRLDYWASGAVFFGAGYWFLS